MNEKKCKAIRKKLFNEGINISAEPYTIGKQVIASKGRRIYQARKQIN